jgi:hypothetical protein
MGRSALMRPAFWNDPAAGLAQGHEHHLRASAAIPPVRQCCVLNACFDQLPLRTQCHSTLLFSPNFQRAEASPFWGGGGSVLALLLDHIRLDDRQRSAAGRRPFRAGKTSSSFANSEGRRVCRAQQVAAVKAQECDQRSRRHRSIAYRRPIECRARYELRCPQART